MALINAVLWPVVIRLALPLTIITFGLGSLLLSAGAVALAFYAVDGKTPPSAATWRSRSGWRSCRWSSRRCSTWTATPTTCASFAGGCDAAQAQSQRCPGGDPVRDRRTRRGSAARGDARRARAHDRALALGRSPQGDRAGSATSPLRPEQARPVCCSGATGTCPPSAGMRRSPVVRSCPITPPTRPRSSGAGRPATGLLAGAGTSRGNMFSGDAPRCTATMSVVRDRTRSKAGDLFAYFSDPYGFMRTIALSLADIGGERRAARRQRRRGAPHVDRGRLLPADPRIDHRGHARSHHGDADGRHRRGRARQLRDVRRLRRGRPPLRDSRARCPGGAQAPRSPARAAGACGGTGAAALSPDRALRSRPDAGRTVPSALRRDARGGGAGALAHGEVRAPAAVDEAWGDVGAVLADARQEPASGGGSLARATQQQIGRGHGRAGPNREALAEQSATRRRGRAGGRGTCSSPAASGSSICRSATDRLTLEQISEAHPATARTRWPPILGSGS